MSLDHVPTSLHCLVSTEVGCGLTSSIEGSVSSSGSKAFIAHTVGASLILVPALCTLLLEAIVDEVNDLLCMSDSPSWLMDPLPLLLLPLLEDEAA